jgi:hypothetical protein
MSAVSYSELFCIPVDKTLKELLMTLSDVNEIRLLNANFIKFSYESILGAWLSYLDVSFHGAASVCASLMLSAAKTLL